MPESPKKVVLALVDAFNRAAGIPLEDIPN